MTERYLLLEQPRGRERSIRLSLVESRDRSAWDVKRTTLHGANKGTASEVLERDAELSVAEARFEFFARSYLERGWYPPACQQLEKRDLITRFVGRWPGVPHVLPYDSDHFAGDVDDYLQRVEGATLALRQYRGGQRVLLRVGADHAVVLCDGSGLRRSVPDWLAPAVSALPASMLPAVFEARLYDDKLALSDLLLAKRDVRGTPFSERWLALQQNIALSSPRLAAAYVQLDPVSPVSDLQEQVRRAMEQGYDEVVVRDQSMPYHYGESPDARGYVAWERFG